MNNKGIKDISVVTNIRIKEMLNRVQDKMVSIFDNKSGNVQNNLYSQSLNRSYYSTFHAVRAILAFDQYDSRKHSGIITYFKRLKLEIEGIK